MRNIPEKAVDFIKEIEGFRSRSYYCKGNEKTIGYGHVILKGEYYDVITQKLADTILRNDLKKILNNESFEDFLNDVELTENQYGNEKLKEFFKIK